MSVATVIGLPAVGDEGVASELREALLKLINEGQPVALDAANVDELRSSLIQVVEAAAKSFSQHGLGFEMWAPSDAVIAAYEDLGLFSNLMQIVATGE